MKFKPMKVVMTLLLIVLYGIVAQACFHTWGYIGYLYSVVLCIGINLLSIWEDKA